jgi:hypothetical protein
MGHVAKFSARFFGKQAAMGQVAEAPFPPTREGPILRVPLQTFLGFGAADVPRVLAHLDQQLERIPYLGFVAEWLRTEGNPACLNADVEITFIGAWAVLTALTG